MYMHNIYKLYNYVNYILFITSSNLYGLRTTTLHVISTETIDITSHYTYIYSSLRTTHDITALSFFSMSTLGTL